MTKQELDEIFSHQTVAIVAAAGHGKTEMIVDMVEYADGKQLLLTHTHAGVDALQKRLNSRKVPKNKYAILTIAAFCIRWGTAYCNTAEVNVSLVPTKTASNAFYSQFYQGAKKVFQSEWPKYVLQASYSGIIVDEYQDCLIIHHEMFLALSRHLPVRVLGDPLQGIFSFSGQKIVDWEKLGFPILEKASPPWRWNKTNPNLGKYLDSIRTELWPTISGQICSITIQDCKGSICVIDPHQFNAYSKLYEFRQYNSVLHITKWDYQQKAFSSRMSGLFQVDERQDCEELYDYASAFSIKSGSDLILSIIDFESKCATKVNTELKSYISRLSKNSFAFDRITKKPEFGQLLLDLQTSDKYTLILCILRWFLGDKTFKCYRRELHNEMIRSIEYARDHEISIADAAWLIRSNPALQKRYASFRCLSSRTLLSKGLEFDCVIIDMSIPLSAKEFYVAMTRAMKKIYILSPSNTFKLLPD